MSTREKEKTQRDSDRVTVKESHRKRGMKRGYKAT